MVTHSQGLHDEQVRGFEQTLSKARRQLSELAGTLARGRGRKPGEGRGRDRKIVRPRWLGRVVSTTLSATSRPSCASAGGPSPAAKAALADELFGKRILFTDRDEWSIAEVVAAYRSQSRSRPTSAR